MKYYIIAGEASGDLHGSNLIKALKSADPDADFRVWGGDKMRAEGATLVKHIRELAFMGFVEVAKNLRTILKNIRFCQQDIRQYQPDAVVFIDYPGFNLRIASFCKQINIKTIYYISPQIWAWHKSRIKKIKRDIDKMLVILPFEEDFYTKQGMEVTFTGHPLLDALPDYDQEKQPLNWEGQVIDTSKPIIALLPGSREQEISRILPAMTACAPHFPGYQMVIAGVGAHNRDFYAKHGKGHLLPVMYNQTYNLLAHARAALVTSGTATLETALIGTPQAVCYQTGPVSYFIAKKLIDIKYISLVNLIMDMPVVRELIQHDCQKSILSAELQNLLKEGAYREEMMTQYQTLRKILGGKGASNKAAQSIVEFLTS